MEEIARNTPLLGYFTFSELLQLSRVSRQLRSYVFSEISHRIKKSQRCKARFLARLASTCLSDFTRTVGVEPGVLNKATPNKGTYCLFCPPKYYDYSK